MEFGTFVFDDCLGLGDFSLVKSWLLFVFPSVNIWPISDFLAYAKPVVSELRRPRENIPSFLPKIGFVSRKTAEWRVLDGKKSEFSRRYPCISDIFDSVSDFCVPFPFSLLHLLPRCSWLSSFPSFRFDSCFIWSNLSLNPLNILSKSHSFSSICSL